VITASSVGTISSVRLLHLRKSGGDHRDHFSQAEIPRDFLKTLRTFAVGFAVRPFGALVFGRIGI